MNDQNSTEYVLLPDEAVSHHERMAQMGGYFFDIRVGGGPDTYTAWTVARDDVVEIPFVQATGPDIGAAIRSLIGRLEREYRLLSVNVRVGGDGR